MITDRFTSDSNIEETVQIRQWYELIHDLLKIEPSKRSTCRQICEKLLAVAPYPDGCSNAAGNSSKSISKGAKGLSPNASHGPKSLLTEKFWGPGPKGALEDAVLVVKTSPTKPLPPHSRSRSRENCVCPTSTWENVVRKDILAQQSQIDAFIEITVCADTLASKTKSANPLPPHSRIASPKNYGYPQSACPGKIVGPLRQNVQNRGKITCGCTMSRSSSPETQLHVLSTSPDNILELQASRTQTSKPQKFVQQIPGLVSRLGSNAQNSTSPLSKTTTNSRMQVDSRKSPLLQPTPPLSHSCCQELTPPFRRGLTQPTRRKLSAWPVRTLWSVSPVRRLQSAVAGERLHVDTDLDETKSLTSCANRDTMLCPQRESPKSSGYPFLFPPPPTLKLTSHPPRAHTFLTVE